MKRRFALAVFAAVVLITQLAGTASAQQSFGTLTLDSLSFISFGDNQSFSIPAGSTIRFDFGTPQPNGSIPFTIQPGSVSIGSIPMPESGVDLQYSLGATASGMISPAADGRVVSFSANIVATLESEAGKRSNAYLMPFTTETAVASDVLGNFSIQVTGLRMIEGAWYVQLVGAVTNKENAYPEPGVWVYTVLSGQFDSLPIGP